MELTFCYPPHDPLTMKDVDGNCSVKELKDKLFTVLPVLSGEGYEMRLVCGGRVLQDHLSILGQGKN